MKRIHSFEFTDLAWYPPLFRQMQTDYLQFVTTFGSGHQNLIPLFQKALSQAGTNEIVDLCSGGGGPWVGLQRQFRQAGLQVTVKLTDKYPNPQAVKKWSDAESLGITYLTDPVDALDVPPDLKGMRPLFEGLHHFTPEQARLILQDAQRKGAAIGVFEASLKQPFSIILLLLSPITTLLSYLFVTPFIKPFKLSRLLWTYLIPLVPLATCWDGVISMLRGYSPDALNELTAPLARPDYAWEAGQASTGTPIFTFTYLVGYPKKDNRKSS